MKRFLGTVLPFFLAAALPTASFAQQREVSLFASQPAATPAPALSAELQDPQEAERPQDSMSKSGMFLGIVGMLAGAAIGSGVSQNHCETVDKGCTSRYAFTGALVAGTALVPIGVHIANPAPRRLPASLGVSALAGTLLYFGTRAIPGGPIQIAPFLAAPIQMFTSIKIEMK